MAHDRADEVSVAEILADLVEEQGALDEIVCGLSADQWALPTPSPRWTIAHQIAHLAYFDRAAVVAITSPEAFKELVTEMWEAASGGDEVIDALSLTPLLALGPKGLLADWRASRRELAAAADRLTDDARLFWYGPSMSARSFLTARLMEVWAHGQDVVDTLGVERPATDRLRHIAQLGFLTRGWSFTNRGQVPPRSEVRLALTAPSGAPWKWGSEDAPDAVSGSAEEFCLVVTQRRHLDDTALKVTGEAARSWLVSAQAFAGPPTDGPPPGRF